MMLSTARPFLKIFQFYVFGDLSRVKNSFEPVLEKPLTNYVGGNLNSLFDYLKVKPSLCQVVTKTWKSLESSGIKCKHRVPSHY